MPLDDSIISAVSNSNFKSMAEMGVQNALSHQNRLNILAETALGQVLQGLSNTSVAEGLGLQAAQGGLADKISSLAAAVSSMQASIKGAQTTPPETGQG